MNINHLAERGMVILGPDDEPLDVRPALKGHGYIALDYADERYDYPDSPAHRGEAMKWLTDRGITGPLADACLAAAEEPDEWPEMNQDPPPPEPGRLF